MAAPRVSLTLTRPLVTFLEKEAARLDITMGELVRRLLDQYRLTAEAAERDMKRDAERAARR